MIKRSGPTVPCGKEPEETIHLAFPHHQAGRIAEAASLYDRILSDHPDHPDALPLRGIIAHRASVRQSDTRIHRRLLFLRRSGKTVAIIPPQWRAKDIVKEMEKNGIRVREILIEHEGSLIDYTTYDHPYR